MVLTGLQPRSDSPHLHLLPFLSLVAGWNKTQEVRRGGETVRGRLTQPGEDLLHGGGEDAHWRAAQDVPAVGENLQPGEAGQTAGQLSQQVVVQ